MLPFRVITLRYYLTEEGKSPFEGRPELASSCVCTSVTRRNKKARNKNARNKNAYEQCMACMTCKLTEVELAHRLKEAWWSVVEHANIDPPCEVMLHRVQPSAADSAPDAADWAGVSALC